MASEVYIFGSWQGPRKQDLRLFWSGIHPAPNVSGRLSQSHLEAINMQDPQGSTSGARCGSKNKLIVLSVCWSPVTPLQLRIPTNSACLGGSLPMSPASIILDAMQPASSHRHFQIEQSAFAATDFRTFRDANWLNNAKLEMPQLTRTNSERRGME
ncbi:uncharacterized protein PADG_02429 [Paracoccidioides brasiliensis Pb18]|uniref:Uncharacterized protein n=1 Tax=Paracoccidioides brasiliensis (strain Pb18) TaxID=502780 RepID=C1G5H4_PARBD|nr:uncharacterized protein PADG_02429 [Paracoccidioides brasiliensis Pb18]EEH46331.2 hypothetical protein PADG_02429 [Paracoccidioides brasiliensis Pb18]